MVYVCIYMYLYTFSLVSPLSSGVDSLLVNAHTTETFDSPRPVATLPYYMPPTASLERRPYRVAVQQLWQIRVAGYISIYFQTILLLLLSLLLRSNPVLGLSDGTVSPAQLERATLMNDAMPSQRGLPYRISKSIDVPKSIFGGHLSIQVTVSNWRLLNWTRWVLCKLKLFIGENIYIYISDKIALKIM